MTFRCNPDLSIRKIDDELFIYDRNQSLIHTFNETGIAIWEGLEQQLSPSQIAKKLTNDFDVEEETALKDVERFLEILNRSGLTQ